LDLEYLENSERRLIDGGQSVEPTDHATNWIMFTPTDLLKEYLKEAFAQEGIAASNQRIVTWDSHRRELARNRFGVLRTSQSRGLIEKPDLEAIRPETLTRQIEWFEDFYDWQANEFWKQLEGAVEELRQHPSTAFAELGEALSSPINSSSDGIRVSAFLALIEMNEKISELIKSAKARTDNQIRRSLNEIVNADRSFIDDLVQFLNKLASDATEDPDSEEDEEEEPDTPRTGRRAAVDAYMRAIRSLALAKARRRSVGRETRSGKIVDWLGPRLPEEEYLAKLGNDLIGQSAARQFRNPVQRFLSRTTNRYRRFRRDRQAAGIWYSANQLPADQVSPLEVDLILLAIFRTGSEILQDARAQRQIDSPQLQQLRALQGLQLNQVMVDEATDFSAIQLACMYSMTNERIRSFFGCGDFNQRLTTWGVRGEQEFKWAVPDLQFETININYRHTRQLNEFAHHLSASSADGASRAVLPQEVDTEGYDPAMCCGLSDVSETARWLADRVREIESKTGMLPTIAVLVNSEEAVGPLAKALNEALETSNIRAVPFHQGQAIGEENDVRVFDVRHIKGLEFEAVFFVGVDELEQRRPDLFEKFLYVGATRAATFLGLTCAGNTAPRLLREYEEGLVSSWA